MGFSLGNLSFGNVLAGFAERDIELRDKAREDSLKLAKDTLNYRAELGMSRRKEKREELKSAVNQGRKLMQNHGFTMQQVGVLASQGKLDEVADLYDKASVDPNFKGTLPDANTVVSIMEEKPIDMPFEQYMRSIVIGEVDTSRSFERDIGAGAKPSDAFFRLTGFDPYEDARKYQTEYERSLGMTADELGAYAFDTFVPERVEGKVDITGFRTAQKGARGDILFGKARNELAETIANSMGLNSDFQAYGDQRIFLGIRERGERANQAAIIIDQAARAVEDIVTEKGPESFGEAVAEIRPKLLDPRFRQELYNRATGAGEGTPLPDASVRTDDRGATGFMDEATVTSINEAQDEQALRKIIADISSRPGARQEMERIRQILRNRNLSLEEKKKQIIQSSSAQEPSVEPSESPERRYDRRGRAVDETPSTEEVATARRELEARGVDTMDKNAIKTAMLAQTKPMVDVARKEFTGTDTEFFQMLGREYDVLAQAIVDDAQGGLV